MIPERRRAQNKAICYATLNIEIWLLVPSLLLANLAKVAMSATQLVGHKDASRGALRKMFSYSTDDIHDISTLTPNPAVAILFLAGAVSGNGEGIALRGVKTSVWGMCIPCDALLPVGGGMGGSCLGMGRARLEVSLSDFGFIDPFATRLSLQPRGQRSSY